MEIAKGFYKIAKSDFETAKILFNNNKFPEAIYYFQQSVEKLSKAFGLKNNFIKVEDLSRAISHKSEKVFTKQMKSQQPDLEEAIKLEELFPDFFKIETDNINLDLTGFSQQIHESSNALQQLKSKDFLWLSHDDIDYLLDNIIKIDPNIEVNLDDLKVNLPDFFDAIITEIENKFGKQLIEEREFINDKKTMSELLSFYQLIIPLNFKYLHVYSSLFFLSLITAGHNQLTRYPCMDCGCLPQDNYKFETPIVNRFNDLSEELEKSIRYYEEIENFEVTNPVN